MHTAYCYGRESLEKEIMGTSGLIAMHDHLTSLNKQTTVTAAIFKSEMIGQCGRCKHYASKHTPIL